MAIQKDRKRRVKYIENRYTHPNEDLSVESSLAYMTLSDFRILKSVLNNNKS